MNKVGVNTPPTTPDPNAARSGHHLEQKDRQNFVPEPILMKERTKQSLTVSANCGIQYRQRADNRAAERQFKRYRDVNLREQAFGKTEETQIAGRQEAQDNADTTERYYFPSGVQIEAGRFIQRLAAAQNL